MEWLGTGGRISEAASFTRGRKFRRPMPTVRSEIGRYRASPCEFAGFAAGVGRRIAGVIDDGVKARSTTAASRAVVIGGTSLFGGSGGAIGSIFGAFVLRTIGDLLLVFDLDPLWQPCSWGWCCLFPSALVPFGFSASGTSSNSIKEVNARYESEDRIESIQLF